MNQKPKVGAGLTPEEKTTLLAVLESYWGHLATQSCTDLDSDSEWLSSFTSEQRNQMNITELDGTIYDASENQGVFVEWLRKRIKGEIPPV